MDFTQEDARIVLSQIARRRGVSVDCVTAEIQQLLDAAAASTDPAFQRCITATGGSTPSPAEWLMYLAKTIFPLFDLLFDSAAPNTPLSVNCCCFFKT